MPASEAPRVGARVSEKNWGEGGRVLVSGSFSLPEVKIPGRPRAERRINRYYRRFASRLEAYCSTRLYKTALRCPEGERGLEPWTAESRFEVTYLEGGVLSLYTDVLEGRGGDKSVLRFGDIWSLADGSPIFAPDLFPAGADFRALLLGGAERAAGGAAFSPDLRKRMKKAFRPSDLYLTPEGAALFFRQGSVAPFCEGVAVFGVPFAPGGPRLPEA